MNLYKVLIRKDTTTLIPTTVTRNEIAILQEIHGFDYVLNEDGNRIEEGLGNPVGKFDSGEDEFKRLCKKYGAEVVVKIYGNRGTGLKKPDPEADIAETDIAEANPVEEADSKAKTTAAKK